MKAFGLAAMLLVGSVMPVFCAGYDELNLGIAAFNRQKWDDAIPHFDKALAGSDLLADQRYVGSLDRGMTRYAKGDIDGAIADFSASMEQQPGDPVALYERAQAYMAGDKPDFAHHDIDALIAKGTDDGPAYVMRSWICEIQGDLGCQLKDLQTLIALDPKNDSWVFDFGIANFVGGQTDKAASLFAGLVDSYKIYPYAWLWQQMTNLKQAKDVSKDVWYAYDLNKWPGPLMDFYRGRVTEDAAILAASKGDADAVKGQVCEASFYIGEWHLLHGDKSVAKPFLQKAVHECPNAFVESYTARAEVTHDF